MHKIEREVIDTIFNLDVDSVPYYLSRNIVEMRSDSFQMEHSSFEYIPINKSNYFFDITSSVLQHSAESSFEGMAGKLLFVPSSVMNIFFLIFAVSLVLLSIVTHRERGIFISYFRNIFSKRLRSSFKEQITIERVWTSALLVIQTAAVLSVTITFLIWKYGIASLMISNIYILLMYVFVGIIIFVVAKYILYRLIAYIFPDWGLNEWVSQYFTFIGLMGLLIYLPSLLILFSNQYQLLSIWLLFACLIAILLVYYRNLFIVFVKNNIGLLNYFLYLCAIEIVPLLIIYKSGEILAIIAGK